MVKKIIHILTREISGLHQAAYLLAFFTLLSQILGIARDRIFAHQFGASQILDIYYTAFRIPDLILITAASIVSIAILVPFLTDSLTRGHEETKRAVDEIFTVFFIFIIGVSIVIFFLIPGLIPYIFPGFEGSPLLGELIALTRILLLSPILLGVSNLFASIVQVHKRFFVYALSPLLYNIGIIVGAVALYPLYGIAGLGYGVVLGAMMHLGIQVPAVIGQRFLPKFSFDIDWHRIQYIVFTSLPRTLTLSINQIAILILISFASLMPEGSIAVFNFSFNLNSVPLALIGASYSLAAFPTLSKYYTEGNMTDFVGNISTALRHIIFWSVPAIVLFIVLRAQIVRTLLGTGEFGWDATMLTAASLGLFVISVAAQSIILLFVRGYYAAGNTRKPLMISVVSGALIVFSSIVLKTLFEQGGAFPDIVETLLRVEGVPGTVVLMLPLAFSIGMIFNAIALWYFFERDFGALVKGVRLSFLQSVASSVILGFASYVTLGLLDDVFDINTLLGIFSQGLIAGVVGLIVGAIVLNLLGNREVREIISAVRKKLWKVEVVGADTDAL